MTAQEIENLGVCGAGSALGFNTNKGCSAVLKATIAIWLFSSSAKIGPDQEIDLDYIQSLQKSGDLIVIPGISTFVENGNDDNVETLEDDTMLLTNKGKYKFLATFANEDLYFNKALNSIESNGGYRTALVDNQGNVFMTKSADGSHIGFTTGMIRAAKLTVASNSAVTKSGLEWQLLNRYELDENYVVWENENLAFDPRQVEPIVQTYISLVNNPTDADTSVTIKVVVDRGRKETVTGFAFGNFKNLLNGENSAPTAGDDSGEEGTYVITVPALASGDKGEISLDGVQEVVGDALYKSNKLTYTVT